MSKKKKAKQQQATTAPVPVMEPLVSPWDDSRFFKIAGVAVLLTAMALVLIIAIKVIHLHYDSYVYLFGARNMNGWEGTWHNVNAHPFVTFMYSRLLLFTKGAGSMLVELRAATILNAVWIVGALGAGFLWLRFYFQKKAFPVFIGTMVLGLNALLLKHAGWPLGELMSTGLGGMAMYFAAKAIYNDSWKHRWLAGVLFGICVLTKYQSWVFALIPMGWEIFHFSDKPFSSRLKRMGVYALCGVLVVVPSTFLLWKFFPPNHVSDINIIFKEFIEYYRKVSFEESGEPFWFYFSQIGIYFGWPVLLFFFIGLVRAWKEKGLPRVVASWTLIYLIGIMFLYNLKTPKYLFSILIPFSILVSVGVLVCGNWLSRTIKNQRLGYGGVAALMLGWLMILSVHQLAYTLSPYETSKKHLHIGEWIRNRLDKSERLIQFYGGSSWITFLTHHIPIPAQEPGWVFVGPVGLPKNIGPALRDGDLLVMNPHHGDEFVLADCRVRDYNLQQRSSTELVFRNGYDEIKFRKSNGDFWRWINRPAGYNDLIFVAKENKAIPINSALSGGNMSDNWIQSILGARFIHYEIDYTVLGPTITPL